MAEKVTSMRLNDEDLEQFKAFAKDNGLNQQQAFNSLIALAELEKAKDVLGDRGKEIESFRDTINRAIGMYVNSLEINQTTEQTIREELQKELSTKDNTISTMYEQLQELKADKINLDSNLKDIEINNKELHEQLQKLENENIDKAKSIDIANRNNNTLQDQLTEYKQYKTQYKELEKELNQLKSMNTGLTNDKITLDNSNKQLQDKLINNENMIKFYIDNIAEQKKDIDIYKADIKTLEANHKSEVLEIKGLYQNTLDSRIEDHQEQLKKIELEFKDKLDLELQKKQLTIDKLNNELDNVKKSIPKTKKDAIK